MRISVWSTKLANHLGDACFACLAVSSAAFLITAAGCESEQLFPDVRPYCVSGPASVPAIDSSGPDLDALCPAVANALCAQWARCDCGVVDLEACSGSVLAECVEFVDPDGVRGAIAGGRMGWSGSQARVFLNELETATSGCAPVDLDLSRLGVGRVPDFEPCTQVSGAFTECTSGSACESWFLGGPFGAPSGTYCGADQGLVQEWQRAGERCSQRYPSVCMDGLRCAPVCGTDGNDGVCATELAIGEPCDGWLDECASGFCETPTRRMGSSEGRCAPLFVVADGQPCVWSASCASHHCTAGVADRGVCAPLIADGEVCQVDWHCESGLCKDDASVRIQQCQEDGARCAGASDCPGSVCVTSTGGICARPAEAGETCSEAQECISGGCEDEMCTARVELGGECQWWSTQCVTGACVGSRCQLDEQPIGAPCERRDLCASGSCVAGACAPAVCTARVDPTGHGYYRWHPSFLTP